MRIGLVRKHSAIVAIAVSFFGMMSCTQDKSKGAPRVVQDSWNAKEPMAHSKTIAPIKMSELSHRPVPTQTVLKYDAGEVENSSAIVRVTCSSPLRTFSRNTFHHSLKEFKIMSVLPLEMFVELNESQISEYKCHLGSFLKTDVIGSTAYHEITDFSIDMSDLNSITMHGDSIELSPSQNDDKDWRLQCSDFNLELKHFMPTKSQSMIQKIIETLPRDRTGHFKKVIQHCRVVATLSENDQVSDVWIGRDLSLRFERAWPENVMSTDLSNLSEVNFHDTPISTIKLRNPDEEVRVFEIAKHPAGRVWLQAAVQSFKDWNDIGIDEPWSAETRILAIHSKSAIEDLGSTIRFFIMPDETVTIDVALETDTRCIHRGGLPVMFSLNGGQFLGAARLPNDYYVGFFYGFDESFTIDESLDWDNETKRALGGKVIYFLKTNLHSGRINDHRAGPGWAPSANWRSNHTENEAPSVHENGVHEFRPELGAHYPYSCWRPYSQRITEEQVR